MKFNNLQSSKKSTFLPLRAIGKAFGNFLVKCNAGGNSDAGGRPFGGGCASPRIDDVFGPGLMV